jgi:hypothetical protein
MVKEHWRILRIILVVFIYILFFIGCVELDNPSTKTPISPTPTISLPISTNSQISQIISSIFSNPDDYNNKDVQIIGYFRGWDLLAEVGKSPPVTRSDWVIADSSGAIYVTGTMPEGLDPSSKEVIWTVIKLTATVANDEKGVYLVSKTVEIVPTK